MPSGGGEVCGCAEQQPDVNIRTLERSLQLLLQVVNKSELLVISPSYRISCDAEKPPAVHHCVKFVV